MELPDNPLRGVWNGTYFHAKPEHIVPAITPNTYGTILFNFRYLPYIFEIKEILADGDSNGIVRRCEIIK